MLKTAECVSPMHPDKLCDRISDSILDYLIEREPDVHTAIEVMGGHGEIYICGEVRTKQDFDTLRTQCERIAKDIAGINNFVHVNLKTQSSEIEYGIKGGGAGDQGIMIGYACRENSDMIPDELYLARSLCQHLYRFLRADGKTQITLENSYIKTIVASWCGMSKEDVLSKIGTWLSNIETPTVRDGFLIMANPAGDWNTGGFLSDTGLTGRKLIVDNYGPQISIGGGAFSGKDPTKVDRSAAYAAREAAVEYLRKNPNENEVTVKLAYAIGVDEPVMAVALLNNGYEVALEKKLFTPLAIRKRLELNCPIYAKTAEWGAFGNGFKWG